MYALTPWKDAEELKDGPTYPFLGILERLPTMDPETATQEKVLMRCSTVLLGERFALTAADCLGSSGQNGTTGTFRVNHLFWKWPFITLNAIFSQRFCWSFCFMSLSGNMITYNCSAITGCPHELALVSMSCQSCFSVCFMEVAVWLVFEQLKTGAAPHNSNKQQRIKVKDSFLFHPDTFLDDILK